ncbi:hypothetical protein FOA52_005114 [Chlamydomonas sp. UWO 241]|nr:hypothetical protein FOA52_005114 [Chlamydomonas sp. UWO 241]
MLRHCLSSLGGVLVASGRPASGCAALSVGAALPSSCVASTPDAHANSSSTSPETLASGPGPHRGSDAADRPVSALPWSLAQHGLGHDGPAAARPYGSLAPGPCSSSHRGPLPLGGVLYAGSMRMGAAALHRVGSSAVQAAYPPCSLVLTRAYHRSHYYSRQISNRVLACEQLGELNGLVNAAGSRFNYLNWTHVLQRLAAMQRRETLSSSEAGGGGAGSTLSGSKASGSDASRGVNGSNASRVAEATASVQRAADTGLMQGLVKRAAAGVRKGAKWFTCQHAGSALLSLAWLNHDDDFATANALLKAAHGRMGEAYTRDLAGVCRGLAEMRHTGAHSAVPDFWPDVWGSLLGDKMPTGRVPPAALVSILMSAVRLGSAIPEPVIMAAGTDAISRTLAYSPHEVAGLSWVMASLQRSGKMTTMPDAASETGLSVLAGHLAAHLEHCGAQELTTFLYSASLLLPDPASRARWACSPAPAALLDALSALLADAEKCGALAPARLVDAVGVYAQLGATLPQPAAAAHVAAAGRSLPYMPNSLRSLLKEHYASAGLTAFAVGAHPEVARVLGRGAVAVAGPKGSAGPGGGGDGAGGQADKEQSSSSSASGTGR